MRCRHRTRVSRRKVRPGVTILELLVAITLASLLLVAVSGLVGILAARQKVLVDEARFAAWHRPLLEQLRWDLSNARQYELAPDRLRLVGYGGRDAANQWPTHRPTEILYRSVRVGDRAWLVREQTQLDELSNADWQREIVCSGVTAIAMDVPGEKVQKPRRSGSVPDRFRILLMGDSPSQPLLELLYYP